ncbi:MAG: hypothetical protein PXZ08_08510 [Actinomycetota bacterium]|jgi:lauroyl/myristoyl acyltransferase|nr:hypothetical protein [Actinomycetota bacterium]
MANTDSLFDLDVMVRNVESYVLLRSQPLHELQAACEQALDNEMKTSLTGRTSHFTELAIRQFASIDRFSGQESLLAEKWSRFRIGRNLYYMLAALSLGSEGGDKAIVLHGLSHLEELKNKNIPILFVSAHWKAYQSLPLTLCALGYSLTCLMDGGVVDIATALHRAMAPNYASQLNAVAVEQGGAARAVLNALRSGQSALLFPEFSLRPNRKDEIGELFGRRIYMPGGAEHLARLGGAMMVPIRVSVEVGEIHLYTDPPLYVPGSQEQEGVPTRRYFEWLSELVEQDPSAWWCWEIFDSHMLARA